MKALNTRLTAIKLPMADAWMDTKGMITMLIKEKSLIIIGRESV